MKLMMLIGTAALLSGLWLAPPAAARGRPAAAAQQCRDPYGRPISCTAANARPVQGAGGSAAGLPAAITRDRNGRCHRPNGRLVACPH